MTALEVLKTRRSVRAYDQKPVSREVLIDIVDCARLAPTAMNEQPWEFVVITDAQMRRKIAQTIGHAPFIAEVPACIAVMGREAVYWVEDCSAATQNILLAAKAHGLGSCWIAGEKQPYADSVRELLGGTPGLKFFSLVTVGHATERPIKQKRKLEQVMHWEML
jgi:nitroreductase